jgi:hypothetical protein
MLARAKSLNPFKRQNLEKSASRYKLSDSTSSQQMVSTILMSELSEAYTEIESKHVDLYRSRMSLKLGGADYSWLISTKFAGVKIPSNARMELERLCEQVKPDECNTMINYFRKRIERCQRGSDVVIVFKHTVDEIIKSRPKSMDPGVWLAGRLRKSNTNKIDTLADACSREIFTTNFGGSQYDPEDDEKLFTRTTMELV